ncbi:MAG: SH3 domain-containing protein [Planctomycetes bacterium]|nr:SH3 domain-containing protein [Planctomycetota bacterium]
MDRLLKFQQCSLPFGRVWQWPALLTWLAFTSAVGAQQFPYVAYVTGEQVYVRSGPGQRYYPTGQIPAGYAVEVYRHDGDGWCAIRPPEGSFSWIASHQVRPQEAGIVEVIDEQVVARVGSTLSPIRSAVQVMLPKGERMELIATNAATNATTNKSDDPRWVRVAAPAGEFRWIAASALSLQPPIEVAPLPQALAPQSSISNAVWSRQSEQTSIPKDKEPSNFEHLNPTQNTAQAGLQFASPEKIVVNEPTPLVQTDPNAIDIVAGSPAEMQLAQFQAQPSSQVPPALLSGDAAPLSARQLPLPRGTQPRAAPPRVRFRGLTPPISATLGSVEELELRLSQTVVEPPKQWELEPLEAAANSLLEQTKTPPVRAQLREVLQRIARFQQVQQRYNNPTLPAPVERDPFETGELGDSGGLTSLSSSVRNRVRQDLANNSRTIDANKPLYDATGLLKPVVSKRPEAPKYALVDERGKVVSFITPTPDLNLKPYVGRRIGVHGKRGFMTEYRRAHVTVGRVTPLEGPIRR